MPDYHDEVTRHRKPDWLKIKLHRSEEFGEVARIVREHGLHTICSSGRCPNQAECWSRRTATFMILGDICTRSCKFCATATGKPLPPDPDEPRKLARSISLMGLKHCVVTSVDRDDLPDGGAALWAESVRAVRELNPDTTIELLIPDFDAREELIDLVADARPDILGHNIETVRRLTPQVRSRARYEVSLRTLAHIARRGLTAKSGLMVGLGETDSEVLEAVDDLVEAGRADSDDRTVSPAVAAPFAGGRIRNPREIRLVSGAGPCAGTALRGERTYGPLVLYGREGHEKLSYPKINGSWKTLLTGMSGERSTEPCGRCRSACSTSCSRRKRQVSGPGRRC